MKDVKIETIEMDMSEIAEYKSNPRTIADYYAKADKDTQELMKRLGLVIVIPKEAYDRGMCDFREGFEDE